VVMQMTQFEDESAQLLTYEMSIPIPQLVFDVPGVVYAVYKKPGNITPIVTFSNTLKFISKECDPSTGEPDEEGYDDEYLVRNFSCCTLYLNLTFFVLFSWKISILPRLIT
jgi:coatomer subunit gamma